MKLKFFFLFFLPAWIYCATDIVWQTLWPSGEARNESGVVSLDNTTTSGGRVEVRFGYNSLINTFNPLRYYDIYIAARSTGKIDNSGPAAIVKVASNVYSDTEILNTRYIYSHQVNDLDFKEIFIGTIPVLTYETHARSGRRMDAHGSTSHQGAYSTWLTIRNLYNPDLPQFDVDYVRFVLNERKSEQFLARRNGHVWTRTYQNTGNYHEDRSSPFDHLYIFSPNGDGFNDTLWFEYVLSAGETGDQVTVSLYNTSRSTSPLGNPVLYSVTSGVIGTNNFEWDGAGLQPGYYSVKFKKNTTDYWFDIEIFNELNFDEVHDYSLPGDFPIGAWVMPNPGDVSGSLEDYYDTIIDDLKALGITVPVIHDVSWQADLFLERSEGSGLTPIVFNPRVDEMLMYILDEKEALILMSNYVLSTEGYPHLLGYQNGDEPWAENEVRTHILSDKCIRKFSSDKTVTTAITGMDIYAISEDIAKPAVRMYDHYPYFKDIASEGIVRRFIRRIGGQYPYVDKLYEEGLEYIMNEFRPEVPVWFVVQSFYSTNRNAIGEKDWREPNEAELRFQMYMPISYGAKGLFHFIYQDIGLGLNNEGLNGLVSSDETVSHQPMWDIVSNVNWNILNNKNVFIDGERSEGSRFITTTDPYTRITSFDMGISNYILIVNKSDEYDLHNNPSASRSISFDLHGVYLSAYDHFAKECRGSPIFPIFSP